MLFIREAIDPTNKDTFLFDDKFISPGQIDGLPAFLFGDAAGWGGDSEHGTIGANASRLWLKWSLLAGGRLRTTSQHFPGLVKTKRKLEASSQVFPIS